MMRPITARSADIAEDLAVFVDGELTGLDASWIMHGDGAGHEDASASSMAGSAAPAAGSAAADAWEHDGGSAAHDMPYGGPDPAVGVIALSAELPVPDAMPDGFATKMALPTTSGDTATNGSSGPDELAAPCPTCGFGHLSEVDHGAEVTETGENDAFDPLVPQESTPYGSFPTSVYSREGEGNTGTDALASGGYKWGGPLGTGVTLTYSFGGPGSGYAAAYSEPKNGLVEFNDTMKQATRAALQYWSNVANVTFVEVVDTATEVGDLRFARTNSTSSAWAYLPSPSYKSGDVWVSNNSFYSSPAEGNSAFKTLLHEIGHALGLKHPHEGAVIADSSIDWQGMTVMSYRSFEGQSWYGMTQDLFVSTPMYMDVKTIQYLYGANTSHNAGDTLYSWGVGEAILETLWDGGGNDTIDWSNQSTAAAINLNAGVWNELGPGYAIYAGVHEARTLMIAEGAVIENATGGSGDDSITGNAADNVLNGGAGDDMLAGGVGNDTFAFGANFGNDTITDFVAGAGTDDVLDLSAFGLANFTALLGQITDLDGSAVISLDGNFLTLDGVAKSQLHVDDFLGMSADPIGPTSGDDDLVGTDGDDTLTGIGGNDTLTGGAGADILDGGDGDDILHGEVGDDALTGGAGEDSLDGGADDDLLWGNAAADRLDGGTGNDTLRGGADRDVFVFSGAFGNDVLPDFTPGIDRIDISAFGPVWFADLMAASTESGDDVTIALSGGTIRICNVTKAQLSPGDFNGVLASPTNGDDVLVATHEADIVDGLEGTDVIEGRAGDDRLDGGAGNDTLDGGTGDDVMAGGAGNDVYVVDSESDSVAENAGEGTDTVQSTISWTLGANFENVTLTGSADIDGTGNAAANIIVGNDGANVLTGGGGLDKLLGMGGNDTLVGGDQINQLFGGDGDDTMTGGATWDVVIGGAGADVMYGLGDNDWMRGEDGNDTVYGGDGRDKLFGEAGNDWLDGGGGNDRMEGGFGDDTYIVDCVHDAVFENADEGTDTVRSSVAWTLGANVENLILTGTSHVNGTGNAVANTITGNSGNNTLAGAGGDDSLFGGNGDDVLDGGAGVDTLSGGIGNDTYVVDSTADIVIENPGEGTDAVHSAVTWMLGAEVENLALTGAANIDGTGNDADNTIIGNSASNTLIGGAGNDRLDGGAGTDLLIGGSGNDTYVVDSILDSIAENAGEGADTVESSISWTLGTDLENLTLAGAADIDGTGNSAKNVLLGNSGANVLTGGAGADVLMGYSGNDTLHGDDGSDTLIGGEGNDIIDGDAGNDWMRGEDGGDAMYGGEGVDRMFGEAGNDALYGGAGSDQLSGGAGADTFAYIEAGDAGDVIVDFTAGAGGDELDVSALLASFGYAGGDAFADGYLRAIQNGSDTLIQIDANGGGDGYIILATLQGITATDLTQDNWLA